jgi:hypothetical protein
VSQIRATTLLRDLIRGHEWTLLHPDDRTPWEQAPLPAARFYAPQLLEAGIYLKWLCTLDIGAASVQQAQEEGDKLLAVIAKNPYRFPKMQFDPQARTFLEGTWARCNVQFTMLTDNFSEEVVEEEEPDGNG